MCRFVDVQNVKKISLNSIRSYYLFRQTGRRNKLFAYNNEPVKCKLVRYLRHRIRSYSILTKRE